MASNQSAFTRLRECLTGIIPPAVLTPISLHLGEFRRPLPTMHIEGTAIIDGWTRYPPLGGTQELRAAYLKWLNRRYGVQQILCDGRAAAEVTPGSKQALAALIALATQRRRAQGAAMPAVVLPNPFYPTYLAATQAAGAKAVFYGAGKAKTATVISNAISAAREPVAAVIVCNPGGVCGEMLPLETLLEIGLAAEVAGALLIVDECYTDLSLGEIPQGYLSGVENRAQITGRFAVLHSLSKRSGAPGLRCGFVTGDPESVETYAGYNHTCGVSMPASICAAAAALWANDGHVSQLRRSLASNWNLADSYLEAVPGYRRPEAGFFLWLPVRDDEATAKHLWRRYALSVLPGRYLGAEDNQGVNPGTGHVRVALVHEEATLREALNRLRDALQSPSA